jgi:ParB family chromosome partitioning protein
MTATTAAPATTYEIDRVYQVPPGDLIIGTNVRTDTRPDATAFAASIKARGVVEAIAAYVDQDGTLTVLRGQRRAVVAAQVGTPTGTVPVRVVPAPEDVDRITDQMTENLHRAGMHERETRDGIGQLALLGVSAAQIAKRTAVERPFVDAALVVTASETSRARMDEQDMTLEQAAIFAEFEDDPQALAVLESEWKDSWRRAGLVHVAQRLRDDRAERVVLLSEVDRLRATGLPVLDLDAAADYDRYHLMENLRTEDGTPVPEDQWPTVAGAAVVVSMEWQEPDDDDEDGEAVQVPTPVWVCTDPDAAGLHYLYRTPPRRSAADEPGPEVSDDERAAAEQAAREAASAERRLVKENNTAWRSAETVRREWLTGLLNRRVVPKGAEVLIAHAVLSQEYALTHAMTHGFTLLPALLGGTSTTHTDRRESRARLLAQATTPKAAIMRTLAAVLAAWEDRSDVHTWRSPRPWDGEVMTALTTWGYPASDVELLLIGKTPTPAEPDEPDPTDAA